MANKKIKDLLKALDKRISSNELSTIIGADNLNEVEITDDGWKEISTGLDSLLTQEAAIADPKVIDAIVEDKKPQIQVNTLHSIETRLKEFGSKANVDFGEKEKAHDLMTVLIEKADGLMDANDDKTKNLIESYKTDITKLGGEINTMKESHTKTVDGLKADFSQRELKSTFELQSKSRTWADHYIPETVNKALTDQIWNEGTSQASLKMVNGVIKPFSKEHPDKPLFIDNKEATFESLFGPKFEPYLKKSEAPPPPGTPPGTPPNGVPTQAEKIRDEMERAHKIQK